MSLVSLGSYINALESQFPVQLQVERSYRTIQLNMIVVEEEKRNMGIGTIVMERIISFAESERVPIELTPSNMFGGNKRKLKRWYKSLGFERNKINRHYSMIRFCDDC
ncbi:MAG: GNAT family N-acetyltransferase [Candidatus Heimdallarchaeota archaeon]|nr:GNAT family N-acetyltransferase [Candidatus Heimdallarchaeota archaeon]